MSHNTLFKVVAGMIGLSAGLAFTPVGAQSKTTSGELVTTACNSGQVTVCGTKPASITCNYGVSVTPTTGAFGFSISVGSCTSQGSVNLYKDYRKGSASGTCVQTTRYPADATSTSRGDDDAAYLPTEGGVDESC